MKVLIIGYGNMGKTYANSFISSRFIEAKNIFVLQRNSNAYISESEIPNENFSVIYDEKISSYDVVVLAVKPQDFGIMSTNLKSYLNKNQILFSVMAGITIEKIKKNLGVDKIVRCMPNIPTQIGMGMTVFTASSEVDRKELFIIQNLINTTGKSIYIEKENLIDAATAVSGSGPAYVFYFMQSIIQAAIQLGFTESQAELLVNQTFMGSVAIQNNFTLSNEQWIKKVASKGGTTESALKVFENNYLNKVIIEAVLAANKRAEELGS